MEDLPIKWRGKKKQTGVVTIISDRIDSNSNRLKETKKDIYIMVKGSVQQQESMIINIHAPRYIRQVLNDL